MALPIAGPNLLAKHLRVSTLVAGTTNYHHTHGCTADTPMMTQYGSCLHQQFVLIKITYLNLVSKHEVSILRNY